MNIDNNNDQPSPFPWNLHPYFECVTGSNGEFVCLTTKPGVAMTGRKIANAKLIAAAPELLKELTDLVDVVENLMGCSFWEHSKDDDKLLLAAKAAIKKATKG